MNRKKKPVIIGIGELLWDIFPDVRKAGGAPVNFVYHATVLGAQGYAISAVGNDSLGDEIVELINQIGIDHFVAKVNHPTGTVNVQLNHGIPTYEIVEDVAWDYIPLSSKVVEIAKNADAVCFGTLAQRNSISRNTIRDFLALLPEDSFKILDINLRKPFFSQTLIEESIQLCNILKLNDEELEVLKEVFSIESFDDREACKWLIRTYNLKYLILTAGLDYSMVFSAENISFLNTPKVNVVDTVGAGDSFTGAFITSLLMGASLEKAHSVAVERAAAVCAVEGAWFVEL